jgi:hypothetical protein
LQGQREGELEALVCGGASQDDLESSSLLGRTPGMW